MGTDIHGRIEVRYGETSAYFKVGEIEDTRNYVVFALLAGVRNGFGFAGVETHTPLVPISKPRGLPADIDYSEAVDGYEFGDHSESWVTLREVLDWPGWGNTLERVGILDREEYERVLRDGGVPASWCGGVSGPGVCIAGEEQANGGDYTHVRYRWSQPFADTCPAFRKWVEYLQAKYGWLLEHDSAAVRLVFGFDS